MSSSSLTPKFITFDMLGTLTNVQWAPVVARVLEGVVDPADQKRFVDNYRNFRIDEILGEFKLYPQIIRDSWQRACNKWRIQFRQSDVDQLIAAYATWGPHEDAVEPLKRLAAKYPLVIYSNTTDSLVYQSADKLGVDFHRVFTAEQGRVYKPRLAAFDYLLDQLDAAPTDLLHVSSHIWYDMIPATAVGITELAYIDRGYDREITFPGIRTTTLAGLADLVGA